MAHVFAFRTRDGRDGVVRVSRDRDARACLRIVSEAVGERPRTLAVLESELWTLREWRRHRLDWGARGVWLVAEIEGTVVGQLTLERGIRTVTKHAAEFGITVATAARGLGVGDALMQAMEAWAVEHQVDRLTLGVFAGNDRAMALYRRRGFEEEGVERGGVRFPDGDVTVIRMAKHLDPEEASPRAHAADYHGPQESSRGTGENGG